MDLRTAKDLLHIRRWLLLADGLVAKGREAFDSDPLLQEAGDSLLIKLGEAAKNLAARGVKPPPGVDWSNAARQREKLAHHYSVIDHQVTWRTLSTSLPLWQTALAPQFAEAAESLGITLDD